MRTLLQQGSSRCSRYRKFLPAGDSQQLPPVFRAAATILGGLVCGLERPTAARFSFLLAIPTILGAAVLDLARSAGALGRTDAQWIGIGLVVSFVSAWLAVRWFLHFVSHHSLRVFAAYRLVLGFVVLAVLHGH